MNETLLNKFKTISTESKELQIKEFGFNPSKESLSLDIWKRLNPMERYEIMKMVKPAKTLSIYQKRCLKVIAQYI